MDFDFDEGQVSFRDTVRAYLNESLPASGLRQVWEEGQSYDHRLWKGLAELGVGGVLIDESHGGFGGGPVDLVLVLEELGASCVPEPVAETAVIAPLLLSNFADEATRERWLPRIAEGEVLVAVASGPSQALVPDGLNAELVIVEDEDGVHLVERSGIVGRPVPGADPSRRLAACDFATSASTLLSSDPAARALLASAGATATAALLVGLSRHLVDVTREHLLSRRQFGRLLAEFQVLKHRLADAAVATEAARSLTWHAGYRLYSADETASDAAKMAKSSANRAAATSGAAALQLHGGIGFTWEHDLHLWLQRGKAWERTFGTSEQHRIDVGARFLGVS